MSEATSTPRITAQYLDNYVGRNVMIVGTIVQLRGNTAIMDSAGNINLALDRVSCSYPVWLKAPRANGCLGGTSGQRQLSAGHRQGEP